MSAYQDKVALVTGGASGIGRALCEGLAAAGARVVLSDINAAGAEAVASSLREAGHKAEAAGLDVADAEAVQAWIEGAAATHGRLDFLFNNAGIGLLGETWEQTLPEWNAVLNVNLHGVVHGVMAAYPIMVKQGHGHIVNTALVSGLFPAPHFTIYAATKHAVVGLSISLREEAHAFGVRVSAVCPGFIKTAIMENAPMTNMDREQANAQALPIASSSEACARAVLRGVRRNKAVIVVTGHAKFLQWLYRWAPWLARMLARSGAKRLRRCRSKPLSVS